MKSTLKYTVIAASFLFASCKDDPALIKKREEQKAEIARLDGEINNLNEKLAGAPNDRSAELKDAKAKAETQAAEIAQLESDIASLQSQKTKMEADYKSYQVKYKVTK